MALQQPVASDFRNVISILKATGDLERIGENALSIAWETIRVKGNHVFQKLKQLLSQCLRKLILHAWSSFKSLCSRWWKLAREVAKKMTKVDEDYVKARSWLLLGLNKIQKLQLLRYFMVIRLLERIGDT